MCEENGKCFILVGGGIKKNKNADTGHKHIAYPTEASTSCLPNMVEPYSLSINSSKHCTMDSSISISSVGINLKSSYVYSDCDEDNKSDDQSS